MTDPAPAALHQTIDKLRRGEHVVIVALGDSNTEVTFHTRGCHNWVGLLAEAIFEQYGNGLCTLINSGKCGSSFAEAHQRLERDVLRHRPDAVIVSLGMNDAIAGEAGLPRFLDAARRLLAAITASGAEALVRTSNPVIAPHGGPLPVGAQVGRPMVHGTRRLEEYCAALRDLAGELSLPVVDHYSLWSKKSVAFRHPVADPQQLWPLMSDAIHPGALGHLRFYRELAPALGLATQFPWEDVTR